MKLMAPFHNQRFLPWLFIAPQLLVTVVFFIWPSCNALIHSFLYSDAFGTHTQFAGFSQFIDLWQDPSYGKALRVTLLMALSITFITMSLSLLLASLVSSCSSKTHGVYKSLLIWPYAVAPAVAAILWRFLCHPLLGWVTQGLEKIGVSFDYLNHPNQALLVVILAASWQQFSYNFLFYWVAMKAIPAELVDAAILDGASSWQRFWHVIFPLLSPTTFFLFLMNLMYGFFDTFGIIQVLTHGGPGNSTTNLIYKVYQDGFEGMDVGASSAQSVVLMLLVIGIAVLQFRYLEKKVHY